MSTLIVITRFNILGIFWGFRDEYYMPTEDGCFYIFNDDEIYVKLQ